MRYEVASFPVESVLNLSENDDKNTIVSDMKKFREGGGGGEGGVC